ncbi:WD40 repeat domain-containing serine/threonine protein kinase [Streptomyces sp. LN549]|uniref:WD40 repeat domain-containing serine/threonine protein kinase n=1 Tax=Streptomyces sp. LN549 TaxID=3112979 RepID=UPI00371C0668
MTVRVLAGRYELVRLAGRGGMGEVWEGHDRVIGRRVAVKLLPHGTGETSGVDLFLREARTAGALNHPGIVTVFDLGYDEADRSLFLVMEFLAGRDLASLLHEGNPPKVEDAIDWAVQVTAALALAHDEGVVHRDLKPANLMLTTSGQIKILDFGIARFTESTNKSSKVMGTLAYMPPERFAGHPGDARSDLYSFGCVLHELLTGAPPFDAKGPVDMMNAHVHRASTPPSQARPDIPHVLDDLVLALLSKRPEDRPSTATDAHSRLRAIHRPQHRQPTTDVPGYPPSAPNETLPYHTALSRFVPVGTPLAGNASITSVAFSPDGSLLATSDDNGKIRLWDPATRRTVGKPLNSKSDDVSAVAFSPDGSLLAADGGHAYDTVMLWNPITRERVGKLGGDTGLLVYTLAFSPDGALLAIGGESGTVQLWDPATRRAVGSPLTEGSSDIGTVVFSPDGALLAAGSDDGAVRLWDPFTGRLVRGPLTLPPIEQQATPRRTRWRLRSQPRPRLAHTNCVNSVAFSPDGSLLATAGADGAVRLWDPSTGLLVREPMVDDHFAVCDVAFSPDGSVIATGIDEGAVRLWDPATGLLAHEPLNHSEAVKAVAFSPDGSLLATGSEDGAIRLYARRASHRPGRPRTPLPDSRP